MDEATGAAIKEDGAENDPFNGDRAAENDPFNGERSAENSNNSLAEDTADSKYSFTDKPGLHIIYTTTDIYRRDDLRQPQHRDMHFILSYRKTNKLLANALYNKCTLTLCFCQKVNHIHLVFFVFLAFWS